LYNLLIGLPFAKISDVEDHLKELARVKFNQLDNLREYLQELNRDKLLWHRPSVWLTRKLNSIIDISLHQRNEFV
jgi:hypothetical protein